MFIDPGVTVHAWLGHLIVMVSPHTDSEAGKEIFAAYVPGLAKRFPLRVFCPASAESVAAECKRWPAYGVLVDLLRKWSTENPDGASLRDQRADPLKPADRQWVSYWHKRMSEGFGSPDGTPPQNLNEARANCLSLVRAQSMPAFVEINGPDITAGEREAGWHDRGAMQRTVDRLDFDDEGQPDPHPRRAEMLGHLRRMVTHAAPDMLDVLPPVAAGEERENRSASPDIRMRTGLAASRPIHSPEAVVQPIQRGRSDDLAQLAMLQARAANTLLSDAIRKACATTARDLEARLSGEGAGE